MKNNAYKEFLLKNNFNKITNEFKIQSQKKIEKEKTLLLFTEFNKEVYQKYLKDKTKIIESYFENFENDLKSQNINVKEYYPIFLLEDGFDESESKFFSKYFLEFIKNLNEAIFNGYYNDELLDFTWSVFDRVFHECYHCEENREEEYFNELTKLKIQIDRIDKKDKHLLKQKIEQLIG